MRVKLHNGRVANVYISHLRDDERTFHYRPNGQACLLCTKAAVLINGVEYEGKAYLSLADNFVRKKGTAIALTRALAASQLNKPDRTAIWHKIWNFVPKS